MFTTSIAKIRRAAAQLPTDEKRTVEGLARVMECTVADVMPYIDGISGLREELGIQKMNSARLSKPKQKRTHREECYKQAAARLRANGISVTRQRLADELGLKCAGTVSTWLSKHPEKITELAVKHGNTCEVQQVVIPAKARREARVEDMRRRAAYLREEAFRNPRAVPPPRVTARSCERMREKRQRAEELLMLLTKTRLSVALGA